MPRLDFYSDQRLFVRLKLAAEKVTIGRDERCTVQLPDERVSRRHAEVVRNPLGNYVLRDTSRNGTRINHRALDGGDAVLLPGDRIYAGPFVIVYQPDDLPALDRLDEEPTRVDDSPIGGD